MKKIAIKKALIVLVILLFSLFLFLLGFFTKCFFIKKPAVKEPKQPETFFQEQTLDLEFNPDEEKFIVNEPYKVNLILDLSKLSESKEISAFDMTILTEGDFEIIEIEDLITSPFGLNIAVFTRIREYSLPSQSVKLAYVIKNKSRLPKKVIIGLTIRAFEPGKGTLRIQDDNYEIVGPNPNSGSGEDYVYPVNLGEGNYTFVNPSASPIMPPPPQPCLEIGETCRFGSQCCSGYCYYGTEHRINGKCALQNDRLPPYGNEYDDLNR